MNYRNRIRVGYNKVEEVMEGISEDGQEGDCHRVSSSNPNMYTGETLANCSSTEIVERKAYVGGDGFYTAVVAF